MNQPIQLNFDATQVEPQVPFEAVPANDYTMALTGASVKETAKKTGHYLALDFTILEGEYKGRHIFENLNLWNQNQQAVEIAWRQLSGLCHAANVLQVATVDQLFNIPVTAKVGLEQDAQYGPSNRIKGFSKAGGGAAPAWAGQAPAAPTTTSPGNGQPPWAGGTPQQAAPAAPAPAPQQPAQGGGAAPPWAAQQQQPQQGNSQATPPPWARQA